MDEAKDQRDVSQRERRRQRHESSKPAVAPGLILKQYRVPLVILLLWGGAISYTVASDGGEPPCPGHWMNVFQVTINDQGGVFSRVTNPAAAPGVELHGADNVFHFEPRVERCTGLDDAFAALGVDLGRDAIQVEPGHSVPTDRFSNNATHELRTYLQPWQGAWERRDVSDMLGYQLKEGERVLVTYTAMNASVEDDQERVPAISLIYAPSGPGPQFPMVPVIAITTFAVLGIVLWRTIVRMTR